MTLLFAVAASAATPPDVTTEIESLLSGLRSSDCRFERNGRWYDGERAAAHLQRKLDYAGDRDIPRTEDFIDEAASRSSFTGRAYRVQCGEDAPVAAGVWFRERLAALRSGSGSEQRGESNE
ncbi:hypothetical protein P873_08215 [Arenimonas composti TR7-09 = DSM 18010]|uniref:DUF5329 domain-containing protein n=1 Tax=Arenimonas composti TR7-09 = DSM 18010 TaxID=1121013 RepID=A0A091BF29_9GAMM|nr:hypothetical protein P873_08215 [Arenimonas composti TR7-09 = DSM 18010]